MDLFNKNKIILYLTRNSLWVQEVVDQSTLPIHIDLGQSNLNQAFEHIAQTFKENHAKLIIGNDVSYTLGLQLEKDKTPTREEVRQLVSEYVPETIKDNNFDWQLNQADKETRYIQAFVVNQELLTMIKEASLAADIEIERIKPVSVLLAEQLGTKTEAQIVLWVRWEPQLLIHDRGTVIHSQNLVGYDAQEINTIKNYVQQEYDYLQINSAIIDWPENKNQQAIDSLATLSMKETPLNPIDFYMKTKEDSKLDNKVLEILL